MNFILFIIYITSISFVVSQTCTCGCIDKENLGRSTWMLLHEIVKHADKTEENEQIFISFMDSLTALYPCEECRQHMKININDPQLSELWMCSFHNVVNTQLNKPLYNCSTFW